MSENKVRLLTRKEAAEKLRVSMRTVDRLTSEGVLIGARMGGWRIVYREDQLDAYIQEQFEAAAAQ